MVDWDALVIGPLMNVFGEPLLFMPASGTPYSITGVFDEAYTAVDGISDSMPLTTAMPVAGVQDSQFVAPPQQGDQLQRVSNRKIYVVKDPRPDGHGSTKLMLNFVSQG